MKTLHQLAMWACAIVAGAMLAACATTSTLTAAQKSQISTAQGSCPAIAGKDNQLSFRIAPVIAGKEIHPITSKLSSTGLGDELIVKTLFAQRLCILEELATPPERAAMTKVHEKYMEEIAIAIKAWPVYDAARYDELMDRLYAQKKAHKEAVNARFSEKRYQLDAAVLVAAIPYHDFLHIRGYDVQWQTDGAPRGAKIIAPAGKVCLSGDDFSVAIRPALDQTRAIVIGLGMGKYDEAQALRLMLEQIYEAGGQRLVIARDANRNTPPVKCSVSGEADRVAASQAVK